MCSQAGGTPPIEVPQLVPPQLPQSLCWSKSLPELHSISQLDVSVSQNLGVPASLTPMQHGVGLTLWTEALELLQVCKHLQRETVETCI